MLQQHLPPAVYAEGCETAEEQRDDEVHTSQVPERSEDKTNVIRQQYLPFAVLKPLSLFQSLNGTMIVATPPTACGIETRTSYRSVQFLLRSCNNTYRLRYAPKGARQQRSKATMRSTHLKYLNEVKVKQRR